MGEICTSFFLAVKYLSVKNAVKHENIACYVAVFLGRVEKIQRG